MSTEEEQEQVYWITRWALTEGILRWEPEEPQDVTVVDGVLVIQRWHTDYSNQGGPSATEREPAHLAAHEWALSEAEAVEKVRVVAGKKAIELEKRLRRFAAINNGTRAVRVKSVSKSNNWSAWGIE